MKTYNTKLGAIVFTIVMALDVAVYLPMHSHPDSGWLGGLWMSFNLPGIPVFHFLAGMLQAGSLGMACLFFGSILFSAAFWSVVTGFVFRRKYAA
jgi:hypothetical protein